MNSTILPTQHSTVVYMIQLNKPTKKYYMFAIDASKVALIYNDHIIHVSLPFPFLQLPTPC